MPGLNYRLVIAYQNFPMTLRSAFLSIESQWT